MTKLAFCTLATGLITALTLAGCASLSPHQSPDPAELAKSPNLLEGSTPERMDRSFAYTVEQARIWQKRANGHSNNQQALYAVALPTSAVAAYYAITGDRGDSAITALSSVSAGAFGLSYLSQSRPRQTVYLAGAEALTCVLWRAAPLAMPKDRYDGLQNSASQIEGLTAAVQASRDALNAATRTGAEPSLKNEIDTALGKAETEVSAAANASAGAYGLLAEVDMMPVQMLAQTQKVASMVSRQLVALEPSPESVLEVARGFNPAVRSLRSSLTAAPAAEPQTKSDPKGATLGSQTQLDALRNLQSATAALQARRVVVAGIVEAHRAALNSAVSLDGCLAEGAFAPVTISPAATAAGVKAGTTYSLVLSGGSGAFDVRVVGGNTTDVSISYVNSPYPSRYPIVNFGANASGVVSVSIRDVAAVGDDGVEIQFTINPTGSNDKAGNRKFDTTNDGEIPLSDAQPPAETRSGRLSQQSCADLSAQQVAIVQLALLSTRAGTDNSYFVDGVWGERTSVAARAYWKTAFGDSLEGSNPKCDWAVALNSSAAFRTNVLNQALSAYSDDTIVNDRMRTKTSNMCAGRGLVDCWNR